MGSGHISLSLIAASVPRDEGTRCPELVPHGRSSGWRSVFVVRTSTAGNILAAASVGTLRIWGVCPDVAAAVVFCSCPREAKSTPR